jgi:hypothetical protein
MQAGTVLRIARPTDHLTAIAEMYATGLGFTVLAQFEDHEGFDGIILGHPQQPYHLEFTTQREHKVGTTIPANGPYTLCDDDVGAICGRSDINLTLLSMPKRLNRSAGRAENRPQASSEHTSPVATGNAEWFAWPLRQMNRV